MFPIHYPQSDHANHLPQPDHTNPDMPEEIEPIVPVVDPEEWPEPEVVPEFPEHERIVEFKANQAWHTLAVRH